MSACHVAGGAGLHQASFGRRDYKRGTALSLPNRFCSLRPLINKSEGRKEAPQMECLSMLQVKLFLQQVFSRAADGRDAAKAVTAYRGELLVAT